jgi:hypothetical protein
MKQYTFKQQGIHVTASLNRKLTQLAEVELITSSASSYFYLLSNLGVVVGLHNVRNRPMTIQGSPMRIPVGKSYLEKIFGAELEEII